VVWALQPSASVRRRNPADVMENRFDFYLRMESFLARHLGSRSENPSPA
jgi:hypothetical protein